MVKEIKCPYIRQNNFCTHKYKDKDMCFGKKGWKTRCIHSKNFSKCPLYQNWLKLAKDAPEYELEHIELESGYNE